MITDEQIKAAVPAMRAAAKRTQAILDEEKHRHQDAHIDSMKTTDAHVGKASGEPHKDQRQEDLKVDKARITGDPHVVSAPLKTHGETTDEVTTQPEGARPAGGGHPPVDMVHRAAAAAEGDATGGDPRETKKGKRRGGRNKNK